MRKNTPLFAALTSLLLAVAFIIDVVTAIRGLNNIGNYSGYVADYARKVIVFELIMTVVLIVSCVTTLSIIAKLGNSKTVYVSSSITFSLISLYSIVDTFLAYELLKKMIGDYASIPGTGVAKLVFLFIAIILILVSLALQKSLMYEDKANILMVLACLCLLVCCIISFTAMDKSTDGAVVTSTIFLTLGVMVGGYLFINSYGDDGYRPQTVSSYHETKKYSGQSTTKSDDPAEQLKKLKELYDSGVITNEEYTEKRKKYIDKL